jgi:hypothetical protein
MWGVPGNCPRMGLLAGGLRTKMHDLMPLVALIDIMCYYLLPSVSNLPHYLCYAYVYCFRVICSALVRFKSMLLL